MAARTGRVIVLLSCAAVLGCDRGDSAPGNAVASVVAPARSAPPASSAPTSADPPASTRAQESPSSVQSDELVVVAGGDVNLGRELGQLIIKEPRLADPFASVRPILDSADLTLVNLECQLSDQGGETQSPLNRLVFTGPPGGADLLARSGIDLVSLANNHMWDYGKKALMETFDHLDRAKVAYVGASRERDRMYEPTIIERNGWSIAVFAVTHIWNQGTIKTHEGRFHVAWARYDILHKKLAKARREHDVVLFSYHGGSEYIPMPLEYTKEFIRPVMRSGVDALIGHHPQVPQGVGWYDGRPIFYSLGNLVFRMHSDYPETGTSFLARLTFSKGQGLTKVEACPYYLHFENPVLFSGETQTAREASIRGHLRRISLYVGGTHVGEPGEYSCMELGPPTKEEKAVRVRQPAAAD
jgi:poly-gamma-glutamate synthesis protein (capsule biosynthesis protein)